MPSENLTHADRTLMWFFGGDSAFSVLGRCWLLAVLIVMAAGVVELALIWVVFTFAINT